MTPVRLGPVAEERFNGVDASAGVSSTTWVESIMSRVSPLYHFLT